MEEVLIRVDDRERPSGVADELRKLSGAIVRIEHLSLGDYSIGGEVLIERKTATDFAQSLIDGRLFSQAKRLADSQFRAACLLEGGCAEWLGLGVSREAIQGALVTLMLIFDIPVFRSSGPAESARMIFYIGSQMARLRDPGYVPYRQAKAKRKKEQQIRILRSFPGVGPDRAKALLDRFKTVRACLNASRNDLMDVKGVGPRTAAAIYNVVNG